jgi:hypothetical protein
MRLHHVAYVTRSVEEKMVQLTEVLGCRPAGPIVTDEVQGVRIQFMEMSGRAVIATFIDQPTTRRERDRQQQQHRPTLRCPHLREASDPFAVGSGRFEASVEHVGSDGGDLPLTQIGRQSTPSRTGFESL